VNPKLAKQCARIEAQIDQLNDEIRAIEMGHYEPAKSRSMISYRKARVSALAMALDELKTPELL
jgi:hypothetical protein